MNKENSLKESLGLVGNLAKIHEIITIQGQLNANLKEMKEGTEKEIVYGLLIYFAGMSDLILACLSTLNESAESGSFSDSKLNRLHGYLLKNHMEFK